MAIPTFNPPKAPSPQSSKTQDLKLLKAEFGDGYTQITRDGINHVKRKARLIWDSLREAHSTEIHDFFEGLGGDQPFKYKVPDDGEIRRWRCEKWETQFTTYNRRTITADIVEDFSLAT